MLRRTTAIFAIAAAALLALGVGASAKDAKRTGQELYKEYCKSCHLPDSDNGEYTPMSLIQDQWKEFFDEKLVPAHEGLVDPNHDDQKVLELMTEDELELLRDWTIDHAADSEHPMTCG